MRERAKKYRLGWITLALLILAMLLPFGLHWLLFDEWDFVLLIFAPLFFLVVTLIYQFLNLTPSSPGLWNLQFPSGVLLLVIFGAGGLYFLLHTTWAAWLILVSIYVMSLVISRLMLVNTNKVRNVIIRLLLAMTLGVVLVAVAELEGRFSNEEIYSVVEAFVLAVQWILIALAQERLTVRVPESRSILFPVRRQTLSAGLILLWIIGMITLVREYQHSFYPLDVPQSTGISEASPFLCGTVPQSSTQYSAEENIKLLIELIRENQNKGTPEFGLLALLENDPQSAQQFKSAILDEASAKNYTKPVGSVKYDQYLASIRIYYFLQVRQTFPRLFTSQEEADLQEWFTAINRRAQTIEPVDWIYALAFSKIPQGPYANQDIGAGLLALLESNQLSDPMLIDENRSYLDSERRGWNISFKNTDDSIAYQQIWNSNSWLLSQYSPDISVENQRNAFGWLLRVALPDGRPFNINPYYEFPMVSAAHMGTSLFAEPDLLWLEGRALNWGIANGNSEYAAIGENLPINGVSSSPKIGSCLLYGSSGLPDQPGPLAPDKIVLRDGWEDDSQYVLLNLRFTGWHRYKATNAINLLYRNAPLVMDNAAGREFSWLPAGRQQFRDKRVPRENLNSLSVPVHGFQAVIRTLAGMRSRWAQDPPYYAEVSQFNTGSEGDVSKTRISGWHGWDSIRTIYLYSDGPVVVHDQATGPQSQNAGLFWHLVDAQVEEDRVRLGANGQIGEVVFVPLVDAQMQIKNSVTLDSFRLTPVEFNSAGGQLDIVTVFLSGEWIGAEIVYDPTEGNLVIRQDQHTLTLPVK